MLAHAYTPEAITRAMNNGVRTIEHGNLIDDKSARLIKSKRGYMIANLVTYFSMKERAAQFGMTGEMLAKNDIVLEGALRSLEICKKAGVKVGYGTDLLGALQVDQSLEFIHRAKVLKPIEIIRQATTIGAEILRMDGKLGVDQGRRLRRPDRGRRQSAQEARALPRPGRAPADDHEGRQVP